jgi:hypothetical protein
MFLPEVAADASGSKGATSMKKIAMSVYKRRVPAIGAMLVASSKEFQESSPHDQAAWDSTTEIALGSEHHGQSSRASLPVSALRLEPESSLQITTTFDTGGVEIVDVTTAVTTG